MEYLFNKENNRRNNRINERILSNARVKFLEYNQFDLDSFSNEGLGWLEELEEKVQFSDEEEMGFKIVADQEILTFFIKVIEKDLMLNKNYVDFRNQLSKIKYDLAFINRELEAQLIFNDFDVVNNLILDFEFIKDIFNFKNAKYDVFRNNYISPKLISITAQSKKILEKENYSKLSLTIIQAYLRALLLIVDVDCLIEKFRIGLEKRKNEKSASVNMKMVDLLLSAVEKNEESRDAIKDNLNTIKNA